MLRLPTNQIAGFLKVQYLTNEVWDETDFLYADKHLRFARIQLYFTCSHKRISTSSFACLLVKCDQNGLEIFF